jgi:hypothetical protein
MVKSGSSYASQSELTLTFGLGKDPRVSEIAVQWPSGKTQTFADVAVNRLITIDEARGIEVTASPARPASPGDSVPPR